MCARKLRSVLVFAALFGGPGCSMSTYAGPVATQSALMEIQQARGDDPLIVEAVPPAPPGERAQGYLVAVGPGTAQLRSIPDNSPILVPHADIKRIIWNSHGTGALLGVGTGLLVGALAAGIWAAADYSDDCRYLCIVGKDFIVFTSGLAGGLFGALAGGLTGGIVGVDKDYVFGPRRVSSPATQPTVPFGPLVE